MTILFNGGVTANGLMPWNSPFVDQLQLAANGIQKYNGTVTNDGIPGHIELAPDPAGSGLTVIKVTVKETDAITFSNRRSELILNTDPIWPVERWYSWSVFIPEGVAPTEEMLIMQSAPPYDTTPADPAGRSPTISLNLGPENLAAGSAPGFGKSVFRFQNIYDPNATSTSNSPTVRALCTVPCVRGVWNDFVLHVVLSGVAGTGSIEIFKDRRLIFSETGHINTYNDATARGAPSGANFRFGIYHPNDPWTAPEYTYYYKGYVVGDETSSFEEVTGTTQLETICQRDASFGE